MPSGASAGIDIGSATPSEQPSMRAALLEPFGSVMKNWRRKKID